MRLGLILAWSRRNNNSLAVLAGALEADSQPDLNLVISKGDLKDKVYAAAERFDKVFIGFSFMTADYPSIREQLERLKSIPRWVRDKIVLIAGGAHPTGDPEGCLQSGFDYVVLGEGEATLPHLISCIADGESVDGVDGIAFCRNGELKVNDTERWVDLNAYPPFPLSRRLLAPIEISRGCPFRCFYCQTPRIHGFTMRHRSVEAICKYLRYAVGRGKKRTWFISSNALAYGSKTGRQLDLSRMKRLLISIRRIQGLEEVFFGTFPSEVRPEFLTADAASLIREYCDNTGICIGAQSGSQRLLEYVRRGHGEEAVYDALDVCKEYGLTPILDVIFGLPAENEEDRVKTRELIRSAVDRGGRVHAHVFTPLPGTPFKSMPKGRIHPTDRRLIENLITKGKAFGAWMN